MSKINGDKSRFHVARKKNIHRRIKTREMIAAASSRQDASSRKSVKARPKETVEIK
ncbi:MAG: hypothetical protein QOD84_581 [Acidobacteriaceae bacterium]|jgi:hypothetical protein